MNRLLLTFFHDGTCFFMVCSAEQSLLASMEPGAFVVCYSITGLTPGSVAKDFVEAPSQMLENWCWVPKVLKLMSSHYQTQQPLSADLIDNLIKRLVIIPLFSSMNQTTCLLVATPMLAFTTCDRCSLPNLVSSSIPIKVCHQLHFE
jgi:hypothetical protein